jgi:FkbM family methyltransferase
MGIAYAIGNVVIAPRVYDNWAEVITTTVKRQEPSKVILKNGLIIEAEVDLRYVVREIFFKKVYTPTYLPIEQNDVVVDIGANNGVFTLFASSKTRNAIHAVEPSPRNLEILRRNIAINGLHNVTVHDYAVSDKIGFAKLFLNSANGQQNLLSQHVIPDRIRQYTDRTDLTHILSYNDESETFIQVATTTLQTIMDSNNLEQIDFLKLDCEGAESSILRATSEEYLKRVKKIAMEFHDHLTDINHDDLQNILKSAGFSTSLKWDNKSPLGYLYAWRK